MTAKRLFEQGFSERIVEAVQALSRKPYESRMEAAYRAKNNPLAKIVKIADLQENMNLSRIKNPTQKDFSRVEEYKAVMKFLLK